jgi:hypothetical protein
MFPVFPVNVAGPLFVLEGDDDGEDPGPHGL